MASIEKQWKADIQEKWKVGSGRKKKEDDEDERMGQGPTDCHGTPL